MQFTRNHQIGTTTALPLLIAALVATLVFLSTVTSGPAAAQTPPTNPPVYRAALVALYNATADSWWEVRRVYGEGATLLFSEVYGHRSAR